MKTVQADNAVSRERTLNRGILFLFCFWEVDVGVWFAMICIYMFV